MRLPRPRDGDLPVRLGTEPQEDLAGPDGSAAVCRDAADVAEQPVERHVGEVGHRHRVVLVVGTPGSSMPSGATTTSSSVRSRSKSTPRMGPLS